MRLSKPTAILLIFALLLVLLPSPAAVRAESTDETVPHRVLRVDNQHIDGGNYPSLNDKVDALKGLEEGTIIVRFRYTGSSIMSLFSLSNNTLPDGHFHLYITPSAIGSENRYEEPGQTKSNTHVKTDSITLREREVHTVAMVMDKTQGYKFFLDGKLVKQDTTSPRKFLNNIYAPNSAQLGRTERRAGSNMYPFTGDIDYAEVYSKPLTDQELLEKTAVTKLEPVLNPLPDGALITEPKDIFYPGFMSSNNYRIPALLYTKAGTLIAGIDRRVPHGGDSPNNIDAVVRRSLDQGNTWEESGIVINDYPNQASNIDQELLQDRETGRIFSLVDGFPHGGGLAGGFGNNAFKGTGFRTIDGKKYMYLTDAAGKEYTIRDEGKVYDAAGLVTDYTVDAKRNLYQAGVKIDNVFGANSPLKAFKTSYLELYYSDDEGRTWTGPIDLNDDAKEEWMIFLGTGPGTGIQLTQGAHKGRLVFPVYFLNDNNRQASAVIYSDDHGQTWKRGESPNEGRDVGGGVTIREKDFTNSSHEITESQVVEMPDGQLKLFMRNFSGFAQIATSFDGGETWDATVVTERGLPAAYCQMTAIRYNGQIDGKEAVIFSSPGSSSSRINGTVKVGLITEQGTHPNGRTNYVFDWKYSQVVKEGHYAYSSLANLENGEIGLFYEGTGDTQMSFIKFDVDYLKWQRQGTAPSPKLQSIAVDSPKPEGYAPGDPIRIKAVFDKYVMLIGNKTLKGNIGGKDAVLRMVSENLAGTEFVFEAAFPELTPGVHPLTASFAEDLTIYNVYGNTLSTQSGQHQLTTDVRAAGSVVEGVKTVLSGASTVASGASFDIVFELQNVQTPFYAQDITVRYDAAVMDFVAAKSLKEGVSMVEAASSAPGTVRLILASTGAGHAVTGDAQIASLQFRAKEVVQPTSGSLQILSAVLADENGVETTASASQKSIVINPAPPAVPGDVNGDNKVSVGDLGMVAAHYGKTSASPDWQQIKHADITGDGRIDLADLAAVAQRIMN